MAEKRETRQKRVIEAWIGGTNRFFTAEDIYNGLKKDNPGLGIATIYRFLKEMEKERKLHAYICDRRKVYSKKEMNHSHFVCEICGRRKHIAIEKIDFLKKHLEEHVCHVQIEISGVCERCGSKNQ